LRIKEQETHLTLQEHDDDDTGVSVYFIVMPNNCIICRADMNVVYALETNLRKDEMYLAVRTYIVMNPACYILVV